MAAAESHPPASVQETLRSIAENAARWTDMAGVSLARSSGAEGAKNRGVNVASKGLTGAGLVGGRARRLREAPESLCGGSGAAADSQGSGVEATLARAGVEAASRWHQRRCRFGRWRSRGRFTKQRSRCHFGTHRSRRWFTTRRSRRRFGTRGQSTRRPLTRTPFRATLWNPHPQRAMRRTSSPIVVPKTLLSRRPFNRHRLRPRKRRRKPARRNARLARRGLRRSPLLRPVPRQSCNGRSNRLSFKHRLAH